MKNLDLKHRVDKWNLCYLMLKTTSYIDNRVNELVMLLIKICAIYKQEYLFSCLK